MVVINGMDMPKCCYECPILDDNGDYPYCRIKQVSRGYNFNTRIKRMEECPLVDINITIPDDSNTNNVYWDAAFLIHSMSDKELKECYDAESPAEVFVNYKDNPEEAVIKLEKYLDYLESLKK